MSALAAHIPRLRSCPACMDGLDRVAWADGASVTSFGAHVGLRTNDPATLPAMMETLPPGWEASSDAEVEHLYSVVSFVTKQGAAGAPAEKAWILYDSWHHVVGPGPRDEILDALENAVRMKVAEFSPTRVFVHAGVVGWHGKAIVVPGKSFSGKSTLVAELTRAGAVYYSDEYAVFDDQGLVYPFLADASIRPPGDFAGRPIAPTTLGEVGSEPIPLGTVVSTRYREDAAVELRPLSRAEGAMVLLANTVSARVAPERALPALRAAMTDASAVEGDRGEAREAVSAILALG